MRSSSRWAGSLGLVVLLLASTAVVITSSPSGPGTAGPSSVEPAAISGVTGYVYANTNNYAPTAALSGATVTIYDNCASLENMSCTFVGSMTTNSTGFFGMNLAAGSGYEAVVARDSAPLAAAPDGFGGAVQGFTAPVASPLSFDVYPYVPYDNATIVLPGYNCLAAYVDNNGGGGPGCENPVLSWTQDGAYYVNTTDELVFYSFVNRTVYPVADWTPLYQGFPYYPMIPTQLFTTQDGSYIYGWGELTSSSNVVTVEAVNVTTHRVFVYNYTGVTIADVASNGAVLLTGWDGNDSQAVLIVASGEMYDHDLWSPGQTTVTLLPFFEGNNIYWEPDLNGFINVEADGSSSDYVQELQLTGPVGSSSAYSLVQSYYAQWSGAGIVVNGVNGVSFNVTSRELSVQAENSGLVYAVGPGGAISSLLLVTNLYQDGSCQCVPIGPASESDRPTLIASGPEASMSYNGFVNDSWLTSMVPGHVGFYSTNESPYSYNPHASWGTDYTWSAWNQEGQFVNTSYIISQESYVCGSVEPAACTINGGDGAALGTIWWLWEQGLPEFPYAATNPLADAVAPAATDVTSVSAHGTNVTIHWTHPGHDAILNYTVAWGTQPGTPSDFASVPGSASSYLISGLTPGVLYYLSVDAWNLHFHGGSAGISSFSTLPEATNLAVTGTGISNVSLAWTNPAAGTFTNDTVEYGTAPGSLTQHVSAGVVASYTVSGLLPSTRYYFSVLAWNGSTNGIASNIVEATTSFEGATDLLVTGVGVTNVSLAWTNPSAGTFTNLTVDYGTAPGSLSAHQSVGTVSAHVVGGLRASTTYYFGVVAWNGSVEGSASNVVHASTTFPGATDLVVAGVTATTAYLTWLDPAAGTFTNLTVDYGVAPGSLSNHASVGTVSTYTVTGLAPARMFYFDVVAWNGSVEAVPSNVVSASTLLEGATSLVATGTNATNVSLAWSNPPVGTFTNVTIEYGPSSASLTQHLSVGTVSSSTVTGLTPSTTYYFDVVAWNGSSHALPSNVLSVTTSAASPGGGASNLSPFEFDVLLIAVVAVVAAVAGGWLVRRRGPKAPRPPPASGGAPGSGPSR